MNTPYHGCHGHTLNFNIQKTLKIKTSKNLPFKIFKLWNLRQIIELELTKWIVLNLCIYQN